MSSPDEFYRLEKYSDEEADWRKLPLDEIKQWVQERADNCFRIGKTKLGQDRKDWYEDAGYFLSILNILETEPQEKP